MKLDKYKVKKGQVLRNIKTGKGFEVFTEKKPLPEDFSENYKDSIQNWKDNGVIELIKQEKKQKTNQKEGN